MINSTSTIIATRPERARPDLAGTRPPAPGAQSGGYVSESELSKLIRYGCQFELEVHQMAELSQMRAENKRLRRNVQTGSAGSGAGE